MEQQLSGPQRDEAVAAIREEARPAEELAEVLRARDYARLRDILRNRTAATRQRCSQPTGSAASGMKRHRRATR